MLELQLNAAIICFLLVCKFKSSNSCIEIYLLIDHCFCVQIFQDVMDEPHFAADGFTYEGEAIRCWLSSGHDTSPMTNLPLGHSQLTPNYSLRSAIQEWLQQQRAASF